MELSFIALSLIAVSFAYLWDVVKRTILTKSFSKHDDQQRVEPDDDIKNNKPSTLDSLKSLRGSHEAANVLLNLIEQDGAGEWPPRVVYDSWPSAVQPYKDIYLELVPMLPCADPLVDDSVLLARRAKFRSSMQERLSARINIVEVEDLLNGAEAGNWSRIRRDQLNGVYCAVAVLRHAYRYVVIEYTGYMWNLNKLKYGVFLSF